MEYGGVNFVSLEVTSDRGRLVELFNEASDYCTKLEGASANKLSEQELENANFKFHVIKCLMFVENIKSDIANDEFMGRGHIIYQLASHGL